MRAGRLETFELLEAEGGGRGVLNNGRVSATLVARVYGPDGTEGSACLTC
jgi:hypothetical protein